jgi:hypothetical protein
MPVIFTAIGSLIGAWVLSGYFYSLAITTACSRASAWLFGKRNGELTPSIGSIAHRDITVVFSQNTVTHRKAQPQIHAITLFGGVKGQEDIVRVLVLDPGAVIPEYNAGGGPGFGGYGGGFDADLSILFGGLEAVFQ